MLIASLLEPKKSKIGDYWYSLGTKGLYEACNTSPVTWHWVSVPPGYFDSPTPPTLNPVTFTIPTIWIKTNDPDQIPHIYDPATVQWIPIIPPGYMFPPQQPRIGDCWHDTISGFDFLYNGVWIIIGGSTNAKSIPRCTGCFGPLYPGAVQCPSCNAYTSGAAVPVPQISPGNINVANITSGNAGHLVINPSNQATVTLSANQSALKIHNLVEIFADGRIVYDINYTPDKAAIALWDAIAQMSPIYKENEKIKRLETANEYLEKVIQMYKDAGCKLPGPVRAPDPNAAWNAAMGVII